MPLSQTELWMTAYQWQVLTRFAGELSTFPGGNAATEAARYLRYHHDLTRAQWDEVDAYAKENRATLEGAEIDARVGRFADTETDDGTRFDASTVAQEYRLLFGFAAQYTIHPADRASGYMAVRHNMGEPEWEALLEFLAGQEYYLQEGLGDL